MCIVAFGVLLCSFKERWSLPWGAVRLFGISQILLRLAFKCCDGGFRTDFGESWLTTITQWVLFWDSTQCKCILRSPTSTCYKHKLASPVGAPRVVLPVLRAAPSHTCTSAPGTTLQGCSAGPQPSALSSFSCGYSKLARIRCPQTRTIFRWVFWSNVKLIIFYFHILNKNPKNPLPSSNIIISSNNVKDIISG